MRNLNSYLAIFIFLFSTFASAQTLGELPSGSANDLVQNAEVGHRGALYTLALGGPQIFPGSPQKHIDAKRIDEDMADYIDDATAAFTVAYYYNSGFMGVEANVSRQQFCIWATRALDLSRISPSRNPQEQMKWQNVQTMLREEASKLDEAGRRDCMTQARNWQLK